MTQTVFQSRRHRLIPLQAKRLPQGHNHFAARGIPPIRRRQGDPAKHSFNRQLPMPDIPKGFFSSSGGKSLPFFPELLFHTSLHLLATLGKNLLLKRPQVYARGCIGTESLLCHGI
jgi:hypothetical protein